MEIREPVLVRRMSSPPYAGYAQHRTAVVHPLVDRAAACVALLAVMVVSGIVLGAERRAADEHDRTPLR